MKFTSLTAFVAAITLVSATLGAQVASPEVSPEVEKALLSEDWGKVADLLAKVDAESPSPVLRLLKGHACLALNRNNESVKLLKDTGKEEDYASWQTWTFNFSAGNLKSPSAHYLKADALARQQKHEEAVLAFSSGLKLAPNNALLLNARAVCYATLEKWNEAIVDLDDAAKANPGLADIYCNRGSLCVRRSLGASGALAAFNQSLQISPGFTLAKIGKASAMYGLGKWPEAQSLFDECKADSDSGHLAAINAALVREASCNSELAAIDEKSAGVAIERAARSQQQRLEAVNMDILRNDMGRIRNTFVADTLRDLSQPIKAVSDTFKGVMDLRKGDIAGGAGKLAGVGDMIGRNAQNIAGLHDQLSKQGVQDWNRGMSTMQSLRSSGLQGGVSTEDLRRGYSDKGNWLLLARFALQYPEAASANQAATQTHAVK